MVECIKQNACYSCGACAVSCPKGCITMVQDERGFLRPKVDQNKCVQCGLCLRVCPATGVENIRHSAAPSCWSLVSCDSAVKKAASSGGAFISLVRAFLRECPGKVYGAVYTEKNNVRHTCYDNPEDCFAFSKSKYVKSECAHLFPQIRKQLRSGERILFSGSPCQVASLKKYLGKDYDNLITIDFVCGGVPGQKFLERYLQGFKKSVKSIQFRADNGINQRNIRINFVDDSSTLFFWGGDSYMRGFIYNLTQMPSCFQCVFCSPERCSDITLGDFWGLNKVDNALNPDRGISLVIPNTEKGMQLFMKTENVNVKEYPLSVAVNGNPRLRCHLDKHEHFEAFNTLVDKYGYQKAVIKILGKPYRPSLILRIKTKIRNLIKPSPDQTK